MGNFAMDERMFEELKTEIRKKRNFEKNAILGIVIQAMEQGGFGTYDTMVAVCEMSDILDNADYEDAEQKYWNWLREARYEKSDFRRFCKKVKDYINRKLEN